MESLESELDANVTEMIGSAIAPSVDVDTQAALDALEVGVTDDLATVEIIESSSTRRPIGESKARKTKAELAADLAAKEKELEDTRSRLSVVEARGNDKAVNDLGATIALAIQVAAQFVAAQRGPHWLFQDEEAGNLGSAWAVVAAPYAEQLKGAIPWALAIGVTWQSLRPRLEADKIMLAQPAEVSGNGTG